jgi:hypothetical protein
MLILLGVAFAYWTFNIYSNKSITDILGDSVKKRFMQSNAKIIDSQNQPEVFSKCINRPKIEINDNNDPILNKLSAYQDICDSYVTDTAMLFTKFPENNTESYSMALEMADKLRLYHENGIKPIVIVEPYITTGLMEYHDYINGKYDDAVQMYFTLLKDEGITDEMMGTWVPFPESNTPNWANKDTKPSDFSIIVNKYLKVYKDNFPNALGSILLNATTYDPNDLEWDNGDYIHLNQYLIDIDHNLVDSIGIQGFPWVTNAQKERKQIFNANEFLQPDIAIAAAQELRTRNIWFNTGSFGSKYSNDPEKIVYVNQNDRKSILLGILDTALYVKNYQQNEYRVTINLFSKDKSEFEEATDWSYDKDPLSQEIFKEFVGNSSYLDIPISLYDQ